MSEETDFQTTERPAGCAATHGSLIAEFPFRCVGGKAMHNWQQQDNGPSICGDCDRTFPEIESLRNRARLRRKKAGLGRFQKGTIYNSENDQVQPPEGLAGSAGSPLIGQ